MDEVILPLGEPVLAIGDVPTRPPRPPRQLIARIRPSKAALQL